MTWRITLGDTFLTGDPWGWENISGWLDSPGATVESTRRLLAVADAKAAHHVQAISSWHR